MRPGKSDIPGRKIPLHPTKHAKMSYVCANLPSMGPQLWTPTRDTSEQLRHRALRGDLVRVRRGWYADPAEQDAALAAATTKMGAVASHQSAVALWGLPTLGPPGPRLHVTRPRRHQGTVRDYPDVVLHHASLPPEHLTVHRGIPITTPARTVIDIARGHPFRHAVAVADAALRQRLCTREELTATLTHCRGWPGSRSATRVAEFADPRAESPLESISRVAFHEHGLPPALLQAVIGGYDRVDFLWDEFRVVGEADGLSKYTAPDVLRREKYRQEAIAALGFTVFRWTWRDAYYRPDALAYRAEQILIRHGYRP